MTADDSFGRLDDDRLAATDRSAATALVPYAAWCLFATALNISLVRRNPPR
ncbi:MULTISPECIES: tryptophan-rich sensory protein [unclassified Streptomyces]|uniref:tryptophan-rich sensory protein n=1 Tax=unclassified Streptomyces TaxID=2593676 RepID=UPI000AC07469|nr:MULTISPECIES: tryptophan-rich sensory protein [unclassified Streptomyces]